MCIQIAGCILCKDHQADCYNDYCGQHDGKEERNNPLFEWGSYFYAVIALVESFNQIINPVGGNVHGEQESK